MKAVLSERKSNQLLAFLLIFLAVICLVSCSSEKTNDNSSRYFLFDEAFSQLFPVLTARIEKVVQAESAGQSGPERGRISPIPSLKGSISNLISQWTQKGEPLTIIASPLARKLILEDGRLQGSAALITPFGDVVYDYDAAYAKIAENLAGRLNSIQKKEKRQAVCGVLFQENFMRQASALARFEDVLKQKAGGASLIIKKVAIGADTVDTDSSFTAQFEEIRREKPDMVLIAVDHPELVQRWAREPRQETEKLFLAVDASSWGGFSFDTRLFNLTILGNEALMADRVLQKARISVPGQQAGGSLELVALPIRTTWFRK